MTTTGLTDSAAVDAAATADATEVTRPTRRPSAPPSSVDANGIVRADDWAWALDALGSLGDGVLIVDERASVVYCNAAASRIIDESHPFGAPTKPGEEYGLFYSDERTPFPPLNLPILCALDGEVTDDVGIFVRTPAIPAGRHLRVSAWAVRDYEGHVRGAATILREVNGREFNARTSAALGVSAVVDEATMRARAEEALRAANDELERRFATRTSALAEQHANVVRKERLAVLGQLAGGVAHQIRNPLAAIMNAAYVLKRHVSPHQHPNVEDAIRIIHDEVRHANVIITGLLDYARVRTPDRHPASIIEIVDRVLSADWLPTSIVIERSIEDVPPLNVDADQLHGALFNLVRNAVEAMPGGGTLRVEVRAESDCVLVAVSDTGPGISPQIRAHLFEPLHSTKPMGIGLGLVTARTFIESHGGRIAHVGVPNGARFEVRLPLM